MEIKNRFGQQSYTIHSNTTEAQVTIAGGQTTADFTINGKKISPYFVAPWWNEPLEHLKDTCEYALRGGSFGFPFGHHLPYKGVTRPTHGYTSVRNWQFEKSAKEGDAITLELSMDIPEEPANVLKKITVKDNQNILYLSDCVSGAVGNFPVAYLPAIQIPEEMGASMLDTSPYAEVWTTPTPLHDHTDQGYSCLQPNTRIEDMTNVPAAYGNVDLTRHPFIKGFDDIFMYVFDQSAEFNFVAVSMPTAGYVYFQLFRPEQFNTSMIWTSNAGRHFPYWYGKINGVMGIGAGTSFFHYGMTETEGNDFLSKKGYPMFHIFDGSPRECKLICGVAAIPETYQGVSAIQRKDAGTIVIKGKDGSSIETACCVDFLK